MRKIKDIVQESNHLKSLFVALPEPPRSGLPVRALLIPALRPSLTGQLDRFLCSFSSKTAKNDSEPLKTGFSCINQLSLYTTKSTKIDPKTLRSTFRGTKALISVAQASDDKLAAQTQMCVSSRRPSTGALGPPLAPSSWSEPRRALVCESGRVPNRSPRFRFDVSVNFRRTSGFVLADNPLTIECIACFPERPLRLDGL